LNTEAILEIQNGDWGIAAAALAVICGFYLAHETVARKAWGWTWRQRWTQGMRNAVAIGTMAMGVAIRSAAAWAWRNSGGDLKDLSQTWLLIGGVIAVVGFLCVIREISKPLYGNAPWLWTLAAMVVFTLFSAWGWIS